jgi:hypothetical protein
MGLYDGTDRGVSALRLGKSVPDSMLLVLDLPFVTAEGRPRREESVVQVVLAFWQRRQGSSGAGGASLVR